MDHDIDRLNRYYSAERRARRRARAETIGTLIGWTLVVALTAFALLVIVLAAAGIRGVLR